MLLVDFSSNHLIYSGDNGRVLGYDNRHGHHRHFMGAMEPVEAKNFEEIEQQFEQEWAAILEEYHEKHTR